VTIRGALDLPPDDALRAFRARDEVKRTVSWRDFEPEEHARAFTAAKIARLDILADLKESLDRALKEGQTFAQWKAGIEPTLQRKGWWGMVQDRSLTGTGDPVFVGERRLRTIFATNMRVSRAAGQWARIQALKEARPYLRYSAVLDRRTRPAHARWHNIVLPVDHPIWATIYPPNGWNCRCQVAQWAEADLKRRGWEVTSEAELALKVSLDPIGRMDFGRPRRDRPTLPGIDPGWNYNPGAQSFAGLLARAAEAIARARAAGLDTASDAAQAELLELLAPLVGRALAAELIAGLAAASVAAAAKRGGRMGRKAKGGAAGSQGRSRATGGRPDQRRVKGRFADEGRGSAAKGKPVGFLAGEFPAASVNGTLGLQLPAGPVRVSANVVAKLRDGKHSEDWSVVRPALRRALRRPVLIGIDPRHPGKVDLVVPAAGLSRGRTHVIIPIALGVDGKTYWVTSGYGLNNSQFASRLALGWLVPAR
jgi:SPP1 gp7 family putative phage head morphogenesis protein